MATDSGHDVHEKTITEGISLARHPSYIQRYNASHHEISRYKYNKCECVPFILTSWYQRDTGRLCVMASQFLCTSKSVE